jgi:bifunctional DNA-binding transcriptional regulator/antitoxin component of YhaV-PrlF toxin-antitoxin module
MTLPSRLRAAIGIADGDLVEATVLRGKIVLTPKLVVDRSKFPSADDEYTPAQRRVIDARLDESEEDLKKGRTAGPFNSASEMIAHMKAELKKRAAVKKSKRVR